jgi:hypothetical protein
MARSVTEIYNSIMAEKANHAELDGLDSVSRVSIFSLIAFIMAVCMWAHETLWDINKSEVTVLIENQTVGKEKWYREKALAFQYGQELPTGTDQYDNTGLTDAEIEAKKIIKYCSVTEVDGKLRIKVAARLNNLPLQLTEEQLAAFITYMQRIKFAGVKLIIDSLPPDVLKLVVQVWYNPLVLRSDGSRIDGAAATPVKDGIKAYLNALPFNGEYANTRLTNSLEQVDGVDFPVIKLAQAKYGLFAFAGINEKYIPDAGYLTISDENLIINYVENV